MIPDEELISWFRADLEVFEAAAKEEMTIVLFFPEEDVDPIDASRELHDEQLAKLSEDNVMFVMIEHNADRTPSFDDGSPVPTSKLLGPNPSRDYDVTRYPSYLVCDHYGNEYSRFTKTPSAKSLVKKIEDVTEARDAFNEKLSENLEDMKTALEEKDLGDFFKAALKNFKYDVVGLPAQVESIKLYQATLDSAREQIEDILDERPEDGEKVLKDMSKIYRDTELDAEIDEALDIVKG